MKENYPLQTILGRVLKALRRLSSGRRTFEFDQELYVDVQHMAEREQRPPDELVSDLLSFALEQQQASQEMLERWEQLSPREQEVTALICLGLTNPEISVRLMVSIGTVKTHVRNVLRKFGLHSKGELRAHLSGWDFSAWK